MELIIYNRQNTSGTRIGERSISVSLTGGIFSFSKTAVREMKLKKDQKVLFGQQKGSDKNWFFTIADSDNPHAFILSASDGQLLFRCTGLARNILASFKEPKSIRLFISDDKQVVGEQTYFQLIPITKSSKK